MLRLGNAKYSITSFQNQNRINRIHRIQSRLYQKKKTRESEPIENYSYFIQTHSGIFYLSQLEIKFCKVLYKKLFDSILFDLWSFFWPVLFLLFESWFFNTKIFSHATLIHLILQIEFFSIEFFTPSIRFQLHTC